MTAPNVCKHLSGLEVKPASKYECGKCVKAEDTWLHLRGCQEYGGVHCCDSSKNKHATRHFNETGHHVVISAEPGENWAWCYQDEIFIEY